MARIELDSPLFDYRLYRFGHTRQIFRGPKPKFTTGSISFIGGSGTFGRFTDHPFAELVGQKTGRPIANLGTEGAGPGFFLLDPVVLNVASQSSICVLQVMPANCISNRMFIVRPRRNARLHGVSEMLTGIYPEIDFNRFSYARAMLRHLSSIEDNRFRLIVNEMRNAWIARTRTLIAAIQAPILLFWLSQRAPHQEGEDTTDFWHYPNFVNQSMIDSVKEDTEGYVQCVTSDGMPQDLRVDGEPVLFRGNGEPIEMNRNFPSPETHHRAADALIPEINRMLKI